MNILDLFINLFRRQDTVVSPEGICPNCWGRQEYGPTVRRLYRDKQIEVNNKGARHTFIQRFVVNRIDGIRLRKGNTGHDCPTCMIVDTE